MIDLVGKTVEVLTVETTYVGKLIEIGETEVYIESEMGCVTIPVERVISISEKKEQFKNKFQ